MAGRVVPALSDRDVLHVHKPQAHPTSQRYGRMLYSLRIEDFHTFFLTFFIIFVLPAAHRNAMVRTSPTLLTQMLWGLAAASKGCDLLAGLAF